MIRILNTTVLTSGELFIVISDFFFYHLLLRLFLFFAFSLFPLFAFFPFPLSCL